VPTLPILLLNGAGPGMASGFKQEILPRNPKKVKQYIKDILNNKLKPNAKNSLEPYFEGFTGTVVQGDEPQKWNIKGTIKRLNSFKLEISELPVGYSLKQYLKILDDLEENKTIKSYKDKSKTGFLFEVNMSSADLKKWSDDQLLDKLKLVKKVSEIYNAMDENNRVRTFNNVKEILEYYCEVKFKFLQKRKDYLIETIDMEIRYDFSKHLFIKAIVENELIINKRKKVDIVADIEKIKDILKKDDTFDYLLSMSILTLSEERMAKLLEDIKNNKIKLDIIKLQTLESMWLDEL